MPFITQNKTNWKFLLIAVVLAVITGIGIWFLSGLETEKTTEDETTNWQVCSTDSDCIVVDGGCCDCYHGGTATAINHALKQKWEEKLSKECKEAECLTVISDDPSCFKKTKCINNSCQLVEDKTADPVPNEVEGWQTYRNEKYGFEFEYPVKYFLTKISDEEISISKYAEPVEFGYFGTDIKIIQNTQSLSPEEWLAQHRTDFGFGENDLIVGLERIKTGAGNALKFNETGFDLPYAIIESNNLSTRQLIIISGGKDDDVFEVIIDTITAQP